MTPAASRPWIIDPDTAPERSGADHPGTDVREIGHRIVTLTSLLGLLLGGPICMLVTCAPRANAAPHPCCAAAAARHAGQRTPAPEPSGARPCCVQVAPTHAPTLAPPAAQPHAFAALAVLALAAAPAPATLDAWPPGEASRPPASPPRSAAGTRAPPRA